MKPKNDVVPIQLHDQSKTLHDQKRSSTAKLALRIRQKDGSEVLIYNGVNSYILSAILKELS
ncbi:hypothetical protein [Enterococcus sp. DIV0187]|uniref:hypothetical protein n=1 Tax=Enterococcus sp. DIV0187 TaxID=2774644 RepID=UPI003F682324